MDQFAQGKFRPDPGDGGLIPHAPWVLGLTGNAPVIIAGVPVYDRRVKYQAEHVITYNPDAVPVLLDYVFDKDPRVRSTAVYALEQITGQPLGMWGASLDDLEFTSALRGWQQKLRAWHSQEIAAFRKDLAEYDARRRKGEVY